MTFLKAKRNKVFISYSEADEKWRKRLAIHLAPLCREGKVDWWDDSKIGVGDRWRDEIESALNSSKVVVLLISADFYASKFISDYELPMALKAVRTEGAYIIPVLISSSHFKNDKSLSEFLPANDPSKTLIEMKRWEKEEYWNKVVDAIQTKLAISDGSTSAEYPSLPLNKTITSEEPVLILSDPVPTIGTIIDYDTHLEKIRDFLRKDAHRLIILQGLHGVGKTTLAAKYAGEANEFFKSVFWMTCKPDQTSLDVILGKLHSFFEKNGDQALRGLWSDPQPNQFDAKVKMLIKALNTNSFLLVFDEFQNLSDSFFEKNADAKKVLSSILCSDHRSKVMLVSDKRLKLDPLTYNLPFGCKMEQEIKGLDNLYSIRFLLESGLRAKDEAQLDRIVKHCAGNPYMMQIFCYLVNSLYRDPEELLISGEAETKFVALFQESTKDLDAENKRALEMLSLLRFPISRYQVESLGFRFDLAIGPLIDRFLVVEDSQTGVLNVPPMVRNYIEKISPKYSHTELHSQIAEFYKKTRDSGGPGNFENAQLAVEEAFHRFQALDGDGGARVIVSVAPLLVEWGYIEMAEQNINEAMKRTQDQCLRAECQWLLGSIADLRSNYPLALQKFSDALGLFEQSMNYAGVAKTFFRIGRVNSALSNFVVADEYFKRCIDICKKQKVTEGYAGSLLNMGWNIRHLRPFEVNEVLDLYRDSVKLAEQSNDYETSSNGHRQIGFLLWKNFKDKDQAKGHYEMALEISQKNHIIKEIGSVLSELGYLNEQWGDYDKAEESSKQAIEVFKGIGNNYGLCSAYVNLGKALEMKLQWDNAEFWYNQSRTLSASINNAGSEAYACIQLGGLLFKQEKLAEAETVLLRAKHLCVKNNLTEKLGYIEEKLKELNQHQSKL